MTLIRLVLLSLVVLSGGTVDALAVPISEATEECIDCHEIYTPGIVEDWRVSRHARITPQEALLKPELERRISSSAIPEELQTVVVGCDECHSQNAESHPDNFEHFGYQINIVVSPNDCRTCHAVEVEQFAGTKKAEAVANLRDNPVYHSLVENILGVKSIQDEALVAAPATEAARRDACFGCHGSTVTVTGMKTIDTDLGEIEVPQLSGWPNQGVGRENPDGSKGACTACHPRHSFSIEIARKPYTCAQCHLEPDVPAWDVYRESKHGNIVLSMGDDYDWSAVPWTVGRDFRAPTCATCHNALLTTPDGEVIVNRSHDFGARLWVRIFGLIYSHPQPISGATWQITNADGLPLPTTFAGDTAKEYLISPEQQSERRDLMGRVCRSCHGSSWVEGHFAKFEATVAEADRMVQAATSLMLTAWEQGLADRSNPFDEALEHKWMRQWLFYANSVRYASAMSGPDYAAFKNGWWSLTENLAAMHRAVHKK